MDWRRVGAVGTLLSLIVLAATLVAATRVGVAATADLDAGGRHPGFRWPVEHEAMVDAMASPATERRAPVDRRHATDSHRPRRPRRLRFPVQPRTPLPWSHHLSHRGGAGNAPT
jgi:hypothetical protein